MIADTILPTVREIEDPTARRVAEKERLHGGRQWTSRLKLADGKSLLASFDVQEHRPNGEEHKKIVESIISQNSEIEAMGLRYLENLDEILARPWLSCEVNFQTGRSEKYLFPQGLFTGLSQEKLNLEALAQIGKEVEGLVGNPQESDKNASTYLFPNRNLPRSFALRENIFLEADVDKIFEYYCHEKIHAVLFEQYGDNYLPFLMEAAALYFTEVRFPANPNEDLTSWLDIFYSAISEAVPKHAGLPLAYFPREVRNRVGWTEAIAHEYNYPLGSIFAGSFIEKYGQKSFLKLYRLTSARTTNLVNPITGEVAVSDGEKLVADEKLLTTALVEMRINPSDVRKGMREYVQKKSVQSGP